MWNKQNCMSEFLDSMCRLEVEFLEIMKSDEAKVELGTTLENPEFM